MLAQTQADTEAVAVSCSRNQSVSSGVITSTPIRPGGEDKLVEEVKADSSSDRLERILDSSMDVDKIGDMVTLENLANNTNQTV